MLKFWTKFRQNASRFSRILFGVFSTRKPVSKPPPRTWWGHRPWHWLKNRAGGVPKGGLSSIAPLLGYSSAQRWSAPNNLMGGVHQIKCHRDVPRQASLSFCTSFCYKLFHSSLNSSKDVRASSVSDLLSKLELGSFPS